MSKLGAKRKTPKKPMNRKQIKLLPLDLLFSKLVRMKADNTCEYCGKQGMQLHCHHGVVGRRYRNTRFEEDNCACICVGCHWFLGDFPKINADFFLKRIGSERIEQLQNLARSNNKPDLDLIKQLLKEKIKILEV